MPRISKSIDVNAPADHAFAYATDPARQPEWATFIKEIAVTSGDGKSEGTTDRCLIKIGPRAEPVEALWTEYKPGQAFARRATSGMQMQGRMTFSARDGGSRIEWTIDYTPPLGPLGALIDALFMNRVFQNEVEASLENLKAALEG